MPRGEVAQVLHNLLTLLPPASTTTTQATTTTSAGTTTTTTEPFEASPSWNLADLAVTLGRIEPERVDSGVPVHIQAVISNVGTGSAGEFQVVLLVDGELAGRQGMDGLGAVASTDLTFEWPAEGPGRHVIRVAVSEREGLDGSPDNDQADGAVWVSGEDPPVPDLEVIPPEFDLLQLQTGESRRLVFRIRNPSFAVVQEVPVRFWIDQIPASSDWIRHLDPGEYQDFQVPWDDVAPGEHVVAVQMILPETFPDAVERAIATFRVILPGTSVLYSSPGVDKWASLGPSYLTNGNAGGPTGSTGRMDCIAIDPGYHPTMYAGSPTGGIWKTNNGGLSWWPVGDKLPSLHIGSIAVDPRRPSHVYAGTWDKGVFKSVDGGNTWSPFAAAFRDPGGGEHAMRSVRRIFLRYIDPESDQLLIYLATDDGVLRCILNDPSHTATQSSEWALIKSGIVQDMDVSPADSWVVYASISRAAVVNGYWVSVHDGIYRTTVGGYATESDWTLLTQGLPATAGMQVHHVVDIYPANPAVLYTAVNEPEPGVSLALYKSTDGGDTWSLAKTIFKPNPDGGIDGLYNPFVRVQPVNENIVYVGGVGLYRLNLAIGQTVEVTGLHVDQKTLEFIPDEPTRYYALNDGGVWRGTVNGRPPTDLVEPRNQDLRTIQFYDVDCSASNSDVMVGGTQDNGTLAFTGQPVWRAILGGDGNFSIISRQNDSRIYAQHQFLTDTRRTDQGVNADYFGSHYDWMACATGLPSGDDWYVKTAFITLDPDNDTHVLAQGPEVYETKNSGASWSPVGPRGANVKGGITRIQFRPGAGSRIWAVGTSRGQVWLRNTGGSYDFIDEHPQNAAVESLTFAPTDPGVLYVLYRGGAAYLRLWRYEETSPGNWMAGNVTDTLPQNVDALVVCGDPYDRDIAYLGTTRGVYKGDGRTGWWAWDDYDDGLPLVEVKDLLVDPTSRQLRAGTFGRGAWAVIPGSAENPPLTLTDLKGPDWESHLGQTVEVEDIFVRDPKPPNTYLVDDNPFLAPYVKTAYWNWGVN